MGKYFSFKELTKSTTAVRLGIDNIPTDENIKNNINELIDVLDSIRERWTKLCEENEWGTAVIIVNSGYRCDALNKAVGGSKTSAHNIGSAADIEPKNQKNKEFLKMVEQHLKENEIPFDQLINEYPDKNGKPSWIHIGLKNREGKQRRIIFTIK